MRGSAHLRIAAVLALILPAWALAVMAPSIMLFGARLDEARAFAVDNAASRGWRILSVSSRSAVFEQILAGHDEGGSLIAERVLRIYADFAEDADGARVSLRAEEVEWPGGEDEWRTDVTGRYSDNLLRALASLRDKWDSRGPRPGPPGGPPPRNGRFAPQSSPGGWPAGGVGPGGLGGGGRRSHQCRWMFSDNL
ncbi:hypothetical protein [Thiorhodococcus minor]|uniref:Uncharacterized protein n=1 Tax=Thiorhodococcus minor TaxID=57489 RepID=A0A6M0K578_9GAMM|nr:hypothetical protein [Thiorhodococcus minor]NEV64414.1 hypothetical protein [Thiorhodococcus minor]